MTYAVAVRLQRGLVFAADTRTNAGIDNVSQFRKLHFWRRTGDRVLVLLTAGNLAVSQSVISIINEQLSPEVPADRPTLMNVSSMYRAARLVGDAVREVRAIDGPSLDANKTGFSVSCILGGQVGDEAPRLFQIYDEGNFIEATDDTPYLQIGEHKYGKPILDRVVHPEMRLGEVAKLILLSFDATLRSNLSVGMPIDLLLYERDTLPRAALLSCLTCGLRGNVVRGSVRPRLAWRQSSRSNEDRRQSTRERENALKGPSSQVSGCRRRGWLYGGHRCGCSGEYLRADLLLSHRSLREFRH